MKKLIVIFLVAVSSVKAQPLDNNTITHFTVGVAIGNYASVFGKTPRARFYMGVASGFTSGLAKELYDNHQKRNSAQYHDVIATMLGGMTGALVTNLAIQRATNRKKKPEKYKM